MATDRRQKVLLGALVVVLLGAIYRLLPATSATPAPSSNRQPGGRAAAGAPRTATPTAAPDVHLDALSADKPKPAGGDRNLFRFKPKAPPPPPPAPPRPAEAVPAP